MILAGDRAAASRLRAAFTLFAPGRDRYGNNRHYRLVMLASHVIRVSVFDAVIAAALEEGVGRRPLAQCLGLDLTRREDGDPDGVVPLAMTDAAWIWASRLGPPDFSLRVAARMTAGTLGLLSYLLAASKNVAEALDRLSRYYPILSSGTRHRLRLQGRQAQLSVDLANARSRSPFVESFAVAAVIGFLRNETEGACRPVRVWLRQAAPTAELARHHERDFGASVCFAADLCRVDYAAESLRLPLRGADAGLARVLEAHAREQLADPELRAPSVRDRVRACLWSGLSEAPCVASKLGLSARSLRRQLAAEETSFAEILAERRSALALQLLSDESIRVADVAQRVGYSELSSFTRAFRRWHGVSPRAFAAAAATATGSSR